MTQVDSVLAGGEMVRGEADGLTEPQRMVLALLARGGTIQTAAEAVGLHRGTVYRWIKSDPQFRSAYNVWQLEQREFCRAGLLKCAEQAVARLMEAVESDHMLAFRVAKEWGLFKPTAEPLIDPARVEQEIALERQEDDARLSVRRARATGATCLPPTEAAAGDVSREAVGAEANASA